jgi:hypothetical protein
VDKAKPFCIAKREVWEAEKELLTEFPTASIAEALVTGGSIRLYARCHNKVWQASCLEREQLREYLEAANMLRSA